MEFPQTLLQKIRQKEALIGIIGLGYVGVPLALSLHTSGFRVIGFDIDARKIDMLNNGESYFKHICAERTLKLKNSGRFSATDDFSLAGKADVLIICLPTPLNKHREPDLSYVINTMEILCPYLRENQLISLESTTYPGTTDEEIKPRIEKQGFTVGKDIFLVFSPEREDPGNSNFTTSTIPKVVGGYSPECLKIGTELYKMVIDKVIPVSSTKVAEMTKLLENIYRAVNIGLVNELKIVADRMGIDIWEVIDAASTKPFGFTPFYPGPGLGGHCIPIDPFYLTWKAQEYGVRTRFIELAGEINTTMPEWVVTKITDALNKHEKSIKGSKFLMMGIAYKKNIDDMRESPAVHLMKLLKEKGAIVAYSDPYLPAFPKMREYYFDLQSAEITKSFLQDMDCVVIATDHDLFDYNFIRENSSLIIDTRGRYRDEFDNVVKC